MNIVIKWTEKKNYYKLELEKVVFVMSRMEMRETRTWERENSFTFIINSLKMKLEFVKALMTKENSSKNL